MKPNIILVLLDGARVDRLELFPEFTDLQKNGTILNNVITTMPYTVGSVNGIFSGMYGKENGVDGYYKVLDLKKSVKILSEIFQNNGYFTCCDLLHKNVISNKGFDIHQAHNEYEDDVSYTHPEFLKKIFSKKNGKPIFCFLHYTKIHTETVSEVLKKYEWDDTKFYEKIDENFKRYDKAFKSTCTYAKKIKDTIKVIGEFENTILLFFSDHGTGVGERYGERNYGSFTYEETIKTFYMFEGNGILKNKKLEKLHSSLDVFPTLLELCEINHDEEMIGKSWKNALTDSNGIENENKYAFSETGALHGPFPSPEKSNVFCIKGENMKLIYLVQPNRWELYDLEKDPQEKNNIIGQNENIEETLKEKLVEWMNR